MQTRTSVRIAIALLVILGCSSQATFAQSAATHGNRVPLYFEENQGQTASEVHFVARTPGYTAFLTSRETVLVYHKGKPGQKDSKQAVVRLHLAGSRPPSSIRGIDRLPGIVNI